MFETLFFELILWHVRLMAVVTTITVLLTWFFFLDSADSIPGIFRDHLNILVASLVMILKNSVFLNWKLISGCKLDLLLRLFNRVVLDGKIHDDPLVDNSGTLSRILTQLINLIVKTELLTNLSASIIRLNSFLKNFHAIVIRSFITHI